MKVEVVKLRGGSNYFFWKGWKATLLSQHLPGVLKGVQKFSGGGAAFLRNECRDMKTQKEWFAKQLNSKASGI